MHVRCPHCHNPMELVADAPLRDIDCPSCGSNFSLIGGETTEGYHGDETRTIAHFELVDHVGIGHFGEVWKAHDTKLDRMVALKIPRRDQLSVSEAEAFLREARAAAQLKHPHIVSIHEVGREDDTIYIVSDFVEGANLREWQSGQHLSCREAAELCLKLAEALEHAHKAGVVHRDLKPANVMLDLNGEPHIMDFGLAKRETGEITMTVAGQILGTPAYMSPEQARGEGHDADARSDVYSLGVMLFELLTAELPFRGDKRMLIVQILRDEPPRPRRLNGHIPRDLETICLKCLEKEPSRRYASAQALADDLRRFVRGEPVEARPISGVQKAWRFVKRNPKTSILAAAALLLAFTLTVGSIAAAVKIASARNTAVEAGHEAQLAKEEALDALKHAEEEAQFAKQVSNFLTGMFQESTLLSFGSFQFGQHLGASESTDLTAGEVLDRGASRVREELRDQPEIRAKLFEVLGKVYVGLGRNAEAESLLLEALQIHRNIDPVDELGAASSLHALAFLRMMQGRPTDAEPIMLQALAIRRRVLGEKHELVASTMFDLAIGLALSGKNDLAYKFLQEVLEIRTKLFEPQHPYMAQTLIALAMASQKVDEKRQYLLRSVAILKHHPRTQPLGDALSKAAIGVMLLKQGQHGEAIRQLNNALEESANVLGDAHPVRALVISYFIQELILAGDIEGAERLINEEVKRLGAYVESGNFAQDLSYSYNFTTLVNLKLQQDDIDGAEKLVRNESERHKSGAKPYFVEQLKRRIDELNQREKSTSSRADKRGLP